KEAKKKGFTERTKNMLTGKWTPMNTTVLKFNQLVQETAVHSGENDDHYNICLFPQRQIRGIPGDLSLGIGFPDDLSPGICRAEKLEGDTFPGDLPGRHRGAHTVSVKQIFATTTCRPGY
ncbi:hypothetical protein Tco_0182581, partial [Tanacetum coccineum]